MVIDENMIAWRSRLGFRQYIPGKKHKFGVNVLNFVLGMVTHMILNKFWSRGKYSNSYRKCGRKDCDETYQ